MRINYRIIPEKGLLLQRYRDGFSVEDYAAYIDILVNDPNWHKVNLAISDARGVESSVAYKSLKKLAELRVNKLKRKYHHVFLVDQPVATATIVAFKGIMGARGYNYNFCSTLPCALQILRLDQEEQEIEELLKGLGKKEEILK